MNRLPWGLLVCVCACGDGDADRAIVIESDGGESQAAYDCSAPSLDALREDDQQAILDYVARMTGAGAVPAESLSVLMTAYEHRDWDYLERKAVEHACREGVLAAIEPAFPDPGTEAAPVRLPTLDGSRTVALADHAGKHVIVEFWATWCAPCVRSLHDFNEWAGRSPEQLTVLAINFGEDPDSAQRWLDRRGFTEVIGLADVDRMVAEAYLVRGRVGLNYLLDDRGLVVAACDSCRMRAVEPHYGRLLGEKRGW